MKTTRFYILLALLLMAGEVTMQAQEYPGDLDVIYSSDNVYVTVVKSIDDKAFLAFGGTQSGDRTLMKITYDGEILDSIGLPTNRLEYWEQGNFTNGKFRYVSFGEDDNDTLPRLCVVDVDPEDLSMTYTGYNWEGLDFDHPSITAFYRSQVYTVFSKDGSLTLSYPVDSLWMIDQKESIHLIRFDEEGYVAKERILSDCTATLTNYFFSAPDSLGCRIILRNTDNHVYECYTCYTFDAELETVSVVEDVGRVYYSGPNVSGWFNTISEVPIGMEYNPFNRRTYSFGSECPFGKKTEMDVIMGVFDEDFNHLNWTWGIINPDGNDEGYGVCFGEQGEVYMLGWMDIRTGWNLYVGFMDEDLNKLSEIYFKPEDYNLGPLDIAVCPNGGCIVCSNRSKTTGYTDYCIFRITPEDFLNVEEAHSHGFAVATAYPNPGKDVLNIRTGLKDARVEVYDLNGRMVYGREITENVTSINAEGWLSGTYVWKVIANGKEVESGKWIKQ